MSANKADTGSPLVPQETGCEKKQKSPRVVDQIGMRMKEYEKGSGHALDHTLPWLARIDGHHFSKFTRPFRRPFDKRVHWAMKKTCEDLLTEFVFAAFAYTQSDEITLVFPPCDPNKNQTLIFDGRCQKLATLMGSLATIRFTAWLLSDDLAKEFPQDPLEPDLLALVAKHRTYFDARVFNVPSKGEALENLLWRHKYDCRRNSISGLAHPHFPHSETVGLSSADLAAKLEKEKGIKWEDMPSEYKFGSCCKRAITETAYVDSRDHKTLIKTWKRKSLCWSSFALDERLTVNEIFSKCQMTRNTVECAPPKDTEQNYQDKLNFEDGYDIASLTEREA